MKAVALGKDRQTAHEVIRKHSHEVTAALKAGAAKNDLLQRLAKDEYFKGVDIDAVLREAYLSGRAERQVEEFIAEFESGAQDHTRWSKEFSDERRNEREMLDRADAAFRRWLAGE